MKLSYLALLIISARLKSEVPNVTSCSLVEASNVAEEHAVFMFNIYIF